MKWLASCLLLLPGFCAQGAPNPACPQGPLTLAYYDFGVAYHQGRGYDVELLHELAKRLDCPIRAEADYPRIRALKLLELGAADIGASTLITPDRQRYLWLYPYNHSKNMVLMSRAKQAATLEQLLQTPNLRWGAIRGFRHSPAQDRLLADLIQQRKLVIAESEDDLYRMLTNGLVDAIFAHPISYDPWLQAHRAERIVVVRDFFPDVETIAGSIALSKARFDRPAAELWHQELHKMYRDGSLRAILRRYLSEPSVDQVLKLPLE
ncbi:ABC transporter substrate-binding protein [Chromobacterium phragmitis]|uniref:ABC transporter substrate-binding protein n=1 Tax=Chromobacterium phragmitis TaxID=2202141 RepID=A0A344UC83_9NEIS|nr:transporter substrate-binding domain-containing protein [Chromobacterium phragmitis]AXE31475.1 ABC transporter substrate-binding protein [Chromobacterium phragmitis]AXE32881.1 ABC transporter substrate-binding protein [Chromobacterium phragmitis]